MASHSRKPEKWEGGERGSADRAGPRLRPESGCYAQDSGTPLEDLKQEKFVS